MGTGVARPSHVALLRGVNVGGHAKLAMAVLRQAFLDVGCCAVATYLQSGNVVFLPPDPAPGDLPGVLRGAVRQTAGLDVAVVVRRAGEWDRLVAGLPFDEADPTRLHVAFLDEPPTAELCAALTRLSAPGEAFVVAGREIYLWLPDGMGRARMPRAFTPSRPPVTVRNWRTVTALAGLTGQGPERD